MSGNRLFVAVGALGGIVLVLAVLAIAGVFSSENDSQAPEGDDFGVTAPDESPPPAPALQASDVRRVPVSGTPDAIAAGAGQVWVADSLNGTAQRINPRSLRVLDEPMAGFPTDVAAGEGAAWFSLPDRGQVQRVGATGPVELIDVRGFPFEVAAGEGGVWAMSQSTVERIDPSSGEADGSPTRLRGNGASVAAGEGWVWVARGNREVVRISPDDGEVSDTVAPVPNAFSVTVGESAAWALGAPKPGGAGIVTRIDPETGEVAGQAIQAPGAIDVAAGLGSVWVASETGTVTRFDPETGRELEALRAGSQVQAIAIGAGSLWVAAAKGAVYRVTP